MKDVYGSIIVNDKVTSDYYGNLEIKAPPSQCSLQPSYFSLFDNATSLSLKWMNKLNENLSTFVFKNYGPKVIVTDFSFSKIDGNKLIDTMERCSNISQLNLDGCNHLNEESLSLTTSLLANLSHLSLNQTKFLTDAAANKIFENGKNLVELNLAWQHHLQEETLLNLTKCKKLKVLNLSNVNEIMDHTVLAIIDNCLNLRSLNLSWCKKISKDSLKLLREKNIDIEL